jgi:uncharacterized RDD family membrane protein YckC
MDQFRSWWRVAGTALVVVLTATAVAAEEGEPALLGASNEEHLWFVVAGEQLGIDRAPDGFALCHHAQAMHGPYFRPMMDLPRMPVAMTAAGHQVWLVFEATSAKRGRQFEMYTLEARRHQIHGGYYPVPHDRLEIVAPLPVGNALAGLVATDRGPVVLVMPDGTAEADPDPDEPPDAANTPKLLRLTSGRWQPMELPPDFACNGGCRLVAAGESGELLWLLGHDPEADDRTIVHQRAVDGTWSRFTVDLELHTETAIQRVGTQVAAILPGEGGRRIVYLRPNEVLALGTIEMADEPALPMGMADGVRVITLTSDRGLTTRWVDGLTGQVSQVHDLALQPIDTMSSLRIPVVLAVTIFALVMIVVLRPTAGDPVSLPAGVQVLAPMTRLGALLIDMLPGAVLAVLILEVRPIELLGLPLMTFTFEDSLPYILMAAFTMAHSIPAEAFSRRTLGKAILGGHVVRADGGRPSVIRLLIRNAIKTVIVLVPPLGLIVLVNPNRQGLNDLAGRTVVVDSPDQAGENRDGDEGS